ncbi:MAG: hypothetical protein MUF87_16805 [Anaerolineae bacterium]|jgi:hypothetical protein|nr:hypothetical protein [Anaerolineae bacterium]
MALNVNKRVVNVIALTAFTAVISILVIMLVSTTASTQERMETMQTLFTQLMRDDANPSKFIEVRYINPVADIAREIGYNNIVIPSYKKNEDTVLTSISEVGSDFVCFSITGGSVRYRECIPFSNIASVNFEP